MVDGKLYNASSKDIFFKHARGLWLTQKLNKCSVLNQPRQKRLIENSFRHQRVNHWVFSLRFIANTA